MSSILSRGSRSRSAERNKHRKRRHRSSSSSSTNSRSNSSSGTSVEGNRVKKNKSSSTPKEKGHSEKRLKNKTGDIRRKKRKKRKSSSSSASGDSSNSMDSSDSNSSSVVKRKRRNYRKEKRRKKRKERKKRKYKDREDHRGDKKRENKLKKKKVKDIIKDKNTSTCILNTKIAIVERSTALSKQQPIPAGENEQSASYDLEPEPKRSMVPMTREEYEKQQSVVRRVFDSETGRHRLVKGDGEILEEIVSLERHKAINKRATQGDGVFFQGNLGLDKWH